MKKQFEKRRYQEKTVEAFAKWYETETKLATIILPTGTGKSRTASCCLDGISKQKTLWVAHREELIKQAYDTLKETVSWTQNISIDQASQKADPNSDIIVASVQTLAGKRPHLKDFIPNIIVIDEYHHYSQKNKTYDGLLKKYPNAKVLGLTATPFRFGGEDLPLGDVLIEMDIGTAIRHNYLVPIVPDMIKSNTSLQDVKTRMGDFDLSDLSKTINNEERNKLIADKVCELVASGRQGILFGTDVAHAKEMYSLLKDRIRAAEVYGETDKDDRKQIIKDATDGKIDCLVNNFALVEGLDIPHLSFCILARPTKSLQLYIQAVGRVLRKHPSKKDAIVVDIYDKLKTKQSRITFKDVVAHGDIDGEKKRLKNILTADLPMFSMPMGNGEKALKTDNIAFNKLQNFPIFLLDKRDNRWVVDDSFMNITSWLIADNQRIITWTENHARESDESTSKFEQLKFRPLLSVIKNQELIVKYKYDFAKIIDHGIGDQLKIQITTGWFKDSVKFVDYQELFIEKKDVKIVKEEKKVDKIFYMCFPDSSGRLVEMRKEGKELIVEDDRLLTKVEAERYLMNRAKQYNLLTLVNSNAAWKKVYASAAQKSFIEKLIMSGKIRFDIDFDSLSKGDASALIEQVKWQDIINEKFGTFDKTELVGFDKRSEDF